MLGKEFRGLAEAVTRTYGDDPWFFLRELAQNSRDAGARTIWVRAETSPGGRETITFADDGSGMTLAHARRFLFRLYASDKGGDPMAAGRYGIGFWTILRFQPTEILLQSRRGGHSWAVAIDGDFNIRPAPCGLSRSGTSVALSRPARSASAAGFAAGVEQGLRSYCRYLRRNDRRGSMLLLWYEGKCLTEPMALPGPLSLSFRSGPVEGAVGLGEEPQVTLYARGLPVWQGAVLDQMSHLQAEGESRGEIGSGLAPVFLLNGNHLDVTFSRHSAVENRALELVRRKADAALHRLLESSLERAYPRRWHQRLLDRARAAGTTARAAGARLVRPGRHWLLLALLLLVPLELLLLRTCAPAYPKAGRLSFTLSAASSSYRGAAVEATGPAADIPFYYNSGRSSLFRLFAADTYDPLSGFVRLADARRLPLAEPPGCPGGDTLEMRLRSDSGGDIILPLAPGHAILPDSLRIDGRRSRTARATPQGEIVVPLPARGGLVEYRSCLQQQKPEPSPDELSLLTRLPPGLMLPPDLEAALLEGTPATAAGKASRARALAERTVAYDASPAAFERFQDQARSAPWLERVLRAGGGDCDIINGLHVVLLRRLGIPSRLVIGMIGDRGRVSPQLHAWAEYFDRGWHVSDATATFPPAAAEAIPARGPVKDAPRPARRAAFAPLPGLVAGILLLAAAAIALLLAQGSRVSGIPPLPREQLEKPLLQLIQQVLRQPALWGARNPLRRHRLLPTLSGDAISIDRAGRLQLRNKLFMTANLNPLALAMAASGMTVIDLSRALHAPLRHLLPGAVDSDALCRLRPLPPAADDGLLAAVNRQLGPRTAPCLLAPGLKGVDLLRISLPSPLVRPPFFFPRRFIAVSPEGAAFARSTAMYRSHPALAVLRFVQHLHREQVLEGTAGPQRVKRIARRLLGSAHG